VWREKKAAPKKRRKMSSLLARLAGDGCLKMSNNATERAVRLITLGRKIFCWFGRQRTA
jgi:Transposase IS66 family